MKRFLIVAALLWGSAALAQDIETVHLKDGSAIRGELVERIVNDHVTLKLATGETRRIEWANIDTGASEPRGIKVSFEPSDADAMLQAYVESSQVAVTFTTPFGAPLGSEPGDVSVYRTVCTGACTRVLPAGVRYRVGGEDYVPTDRFALDTNGTNHITARLSGTGKRAAGKFFTFTSIAPLLVTAVVLPFAIGYPSDPNLRQTLWLVTGIVGGTGVAMLTLGIVLWATSGSSAAINGVNVGRAKLSPTGLAF